MRLLFRLVVLLFCCTSLDAATSPVANAENIAPEQHPEIDTAAAPAPHNGLDRRETPSYSSCCCAPPADRVNTRCSLTCGAQECVYGDCLKCTSFVLCSPLLVVLGLAYRTCRCLNECICVELCEEEGCCTR